MLKNIFHALQKVFLALLIKFQLALNFSLLFQNLFLDFIVALSRLGLKLQEISINLAFGCE